MSYLKQAQDAYMRLQARQAAPSGHRPAVAAQCAKSALSARSPVVPAVWSPIDSTTVQAGPMNTVIGPSCWACRRAVYWLRRKEVGGGLVCATCHPPAEGA
jgi:hypothetical protein